MSTTLQRRAEIDKTNVDDATSIANDETVIDLPVIVQKTIPFLSQKEIEVIDELFKAGSPIQKKVVALHPDPDDLRRVIIDSRHD